MTLEGSLLPAKTTPPLTAPANRSAMRQGPDRSYQHHAGPEDGDGVDLTTITRTQPQWPRVFPGL
jgi:hypothetical protein